MYSEDGKCWVAGRELPEVIPLTNLKTKLTTFIQNATVGGATPGHIGTAWSWYTLSPNWASVFPENSAPANYTNSNVLKAAILMTDGEYNIHYATESSKEQALALCEAMKAEGITVFTVGFGFTEGTTQNDGTASGNAMDTLKTCASNNQTFFFPYDGAALRQAFKDIAAQMMAAKNGGSSFISN